MSFSIFVMFRAMIFLGLPSAFASLEIVGKPVFHALARDMAEGAFNAEGHTEPSMTS
jgi:hypothetical protein